MSSSSSSPSSHPLLSPSAPTTLTVAVGSTNRCKIAAVSSAFRSILLVTDPSSFASLQVVGYDAPSLVSAQPMSESETRLGATNRATSAAALALAATGLSPDFSVGLEGGVVDEDDTSSSSSLSSSSSASPNPAAVLWCMAFMVVYCPSETTSSRQFGVARTGAFPLPPLMSSLVRAGVELGDADDYVTGRVDSKRGVGTVGVLTNEIITREKYYEAAIVLAMTKFIQRRIFYARVADDQDEPNKEELDSIIASLKKKGTEGP